MLRSNRERIHSKATAKMTGSLSFTLILLLAVVSSVSSKTYTCSGKYKDEPYCYYEEGDAGSNIIIIAPHGGSLRPGNIIDRDAGCLVGDSCVWSHSCGVKDTTKCKAKIFKDVYTKELSIMLANNLRLLTNKRPHLIVNSLHRKKFDGNREINEATFNIPEAVTAFNEFHGFIEKARLKIHDAGLVIDMHGQTHTKGWNELGYLISKSTLNYGTPQAHRSSIKNLANNVAISFNELLSGQESLGQFLQDENYDTVPSSINPKPGNNGYFSGGYNTRMYGSLEQGTIDAVQVETHKQFRNSKEGPEYSKALAKAVYKFVEKYYPSCY